MANMTKGTAAETAGPQDAAPDNFQAALSHAAGAVDTALERLIPEAGMRRMRDRIAFSTALRQNESGNVAPLFPFPPPWLPFVLFEWLFVVVFVFLVT